MFDENIKKKFFECYGISFKDAEVVMMKSSHHSENNNDKKEQKLRNFGRGYPDLDNDGIDAVEKDKENMEILSKW